ncbi:histidine triad nucleotide-binding protein [Ehrlichia canis]|uniref:Histidine triad (HIT) protein n=1 Tax=Ehrlichia canis (strain Jake) TaxID=269484 RepID=A0ACA6AVJ5_EHRCJ|nr:histidine triad nucleotide-binding protein [Ehrlichia canis]AAZ68305.1 Histidine triad (HIT) protein [Ehrlichia canis str. Jake]AUO54933.1 histidine triad nucleotide-binding protein [Ehrlichia canis]UKC53776.1 histidine triad nucleotide-binding protein [Ehrlichia canis]UKC54714.1 histidine triad nucleotide-binding protein [Ehrlichia canis]UKC55650.1 histidine triad nucleotide-binding protein [Ehrlichia canis]
MQEGNNSYDKDNVFAKILRKELPCNIVYEDESVLAFHDIHPQAPIHVLVIPKSDYISFDDFSNSSAEDIKHFFSVVKKITHKLQLDKTGYRIVTNHGKQGGQIIPHFHVHILGGKQL